MKLRDILESIFGKKETEYDKLLKLSVKKIEEILKDYNDCKIGQTEDINVRFDNEYKDKGFVELIGVCNSENWKVINDLEIKLIDHFWGKIINKKKGGGKKLEGNEFWIYVAHKGKK